jgi:hypothetical protein
MLIRRTELSATAKLSAEHELKISEDKHQFLKADFSSSGSIYELDYIFTGIRDSLRLILVRFIFK